MFLSITRQYEVSFRCSSFGYIVFYGYRNELMHFLEE